VLSIASPPALYSHIPGIQQPCHCLLVNEVDRCDVEQSAAKAVRRLVKLSLKPLFVVDDAR